MEPGGDNLKVTTYKSHSAIRSQPRKAVPEHTAGWQSTKIGDIGFFRNRDHVSVPVTLRKCKKPLRKFSKLTVVLGAIALRVLTIRIEHSSQCTAFNAPKRFDSGKCQAGGTRCGLVDVPMVARVGVLYHLAALPIELVVYRMATQLFEKPIPIDSQSFVWLVFVERPRHIFATYVPETIGGVVIGAIAARDHILTDLQHRLAALVSVDGIGLRIGGHNCRAMKRGVYVLNR